MSAIPAHERLDWQQGQYIGQNCFAARSDDSVSDSDGDLSGDDRSSAEDESSGALLCKGADRPAYKGLLREEEAAEADFNRVDVAVDMDADVGVAAPPTTTKMLEDQQHQAKVKRKLLHQSRGQRSNRRQRPKTWQQALRKQKRLSWNPTKRKRRFDEQ